MVEWCDGEVVRWCGGGCWGQHALDGVAGRGGGGAAVIAVAAGVQMRRGSSAAVRGRRPRERQRRRPEYHGRECCKVSIPVTTMVAP